jgi:hypothetical protein
MLPTPNACCVVILVCRRFYRFVSTTNTGGADASFPNRISFIGIQTGRRIVYLDDGVSSRVDERGLEPEYPLCLATLLPRVDSDVQGH